MPAHSPRIYIDNELMEFHTAELDSKGVNTASSLKFTVDGNTVSYRKYWNKEVTAFFDESDAVPIFRGRIINSDIVDNIGVRFFAVDGFGMLTGHSKATVVLDDNKNVDGLTPGAAISKLIQYANLDNIIGTDYIGNTDPIVQVDKLRGPVVILNVIKNILTSVANKSTTLVRENYMSIFDDGSKTQLKFELMADLDNTDPVKVYSYDNISAFVVNNRSVPTSITVNGKSISATYRHSSAATAFGENPMIVDNPMLESKAACMDFAHKIYEINMKNQYEYKITTPDGVYLKEGDVVQIISDDVDVSGNFRVIGKKVSFGSNTYSLNLTINKRPPILSQFLLQ